jgi:hypothetical protein
MKDSAKPTTKRATARDLFVELSEGMKALAEERLGKRTLRIIRHQLAEGVRNSK